MDTLFIILLVLCWFRSWFKDTDEGDKRHECSDQRQQRADVSNAITEAMLLGFVVGQGVGDHDCSG